MFLLTKLGTKVKQISIKKLDLPSDVTLNLPRVTVVGFYQIYIENYHDVVKFTDKYLILGLENKYIKILGTDLKIRTILPEEIYIEGLIKRIDYINKEDNLEY